MPPRLCRGAGTRGLAPVAASPSLPVLQRPGVLPGQRNREEGQREEGVGLELSAQVTARPCDADGADRGLLHRRRSGRAGRLVGIERATGISDTGSPRHLPVALSRQGCLSKFLNPLSPLRVLPSPPPYPRQASGEPSPLFISLLNVVSEFLEKRIQLRLVKTFPRTVLRPGCRRSWGEQPS